MSGISHRWQTYDMSIFYYIHRLLSRGFLLKILKIYQILRNSVAGRERDRFICDEGGHEGSAGDHVLQRERDMNVPMGRHEGSAGDPLAPYDARWKGAFERPRYLSSPLSTFLTPGSSPLAPNSHSPYNLLTMLSVSHIK